MTTLIPGTRRPSVTVGASSKRTGVVVAAGTDSTDKTLRAKNGNTVGAIFGSSTVLAVGVAGLDPGNKLLLEDGSSLLQEDDGYILLEDAASIGSAAGRTTKLDAVSSLLWSAQGSASGLGSASGVVEVPSLSTNRLLMETADRLLLETGDFILLDDGTVVPPKAITDLDGNYILDMDGGYMEGL